MNKSNLLILKAFSISQPPVDFYDTPSKMVMLDSLFGLSERAIHKKNITVQEIESVELTREVKEEINTFLSNHPANLPYYYLIKLVFEILKDYVKQEQV